MATNNKKYSIIDLEQKYGSMTLGRLLASWRKSEGISQREFAKVLAISPTNLCDIEKGRQGVSVGKAAEIASAIGYCPTILVRLAIQEQLRSSGLKLTVEVKKIVA